jgi:hypothetical protein
MGVGRLNLWVSDVADACSTFRGGTAEGGGGITVLDCRGVLQWPCGRYQTPQGEWLPIPNGSYENLPFECGHLEVELPPGCYWAMAGWTAPNPGFIHFNYVTHVGIAEVSCDQVACVKLFNPSARLCWNWALLGLRMLAIHGGVDPNRVEEVADIVESELLRDAPRLPIEKVLERVFDDLADDARRRRDHPKGRRGEA